MGRIERANSKVEVIFSSQAIARRLEELAAEIAARELGRLLVVAVLKGSFVFAADLIRALHRAGLEPEVDFLTLSSYRKSTRSSGRTPARRSAAAHRRLRCVSCENVRRSSPQNRAAFSARPAVAF